MSSIMGRPTLYTPALLNKARDYLEQFEDLSEEDNGKVPSHAGLAKYLGISREYMYQWAKDEQKSDFSHMLSMIKNMQEEMLIHGGLSSKYNPTITKLMLSKHGYTETQQNQGVAVNITIDRECSNVIIDGKVSED